MTGRVLFYVQHLLGVGHLRRAEILAEAMAASGLDVIVAYGGRPVPDVPFKGVRVAPLPAAAIQGADFGTLVDAAGAPVDEAWRQRRRDALIALFHDVQPDVLLLELFPFGRRPFRFELLPLLEEAAARRPRPCIASSVRDILVARKPERAKETIDTLRYYFDAVLVHGDPTLIPFERTFAAAGEIADLIHTTGYVTAATEPRSESPERPGTGEVIVSAGGGAVGAPLLFAAMDARPLTALADRTWRFLTGPNLPDADYRRLEAMGGARIIVERFRPDFAARLAGAALSISQAGYNTTMDLLATGVPAVVIPYEAAGETEQRLRAEILAEKGLLTIVPEAALSAPCLAKAIAAALSAPRQRMPVDLSGAAQSARLVATLAARGAARNG